MNILNLITKTVHCVNTEESLDDAAKLMCENDLSALPVLNEDSELVGMLTDRDILIAATETGRRLADIPVETAQSIDIVCCGLHNDSDEVLGLMQLYQVYTVPVINKYGKLLGIISLSDFAIASQSHAEESGDTDFFAALVAMDRSSDLSMRIASEVAA